MSRVKRVDDQTASRIAADLGCAAYTAALERLENAEAVYALEATRAAQAGLDVLVRRAVQRARADGESWQEIAAGLGVTRQAAHSRFRALCGE